MMQRVDISRADSSDIADITALEAKYIPGGWSESEFREWLCEDRRILLKASYGEKMIGFLNGSWLFDEGELLNIAVDEHFRRCKTGRRLMEEFFSIMQKNEVKKVFLEVREKNASAVCFYRALGFCECGKRKNYYSAPADNAIIMMKKIEGE